MQNNKKQLNVNSWGGKFNNIIRALKLVNIEPKKQ